MQTSLSIGPRVAVGQLRLVAKRSDRRLAVVVRSLFRLLIVSVLVAAPIALPAVAAMTPPDPPWIAGIYDQGDYDDVIVLIDSTVADVEPAALTAAAAPPPLIGRAVEAIDVARASVARTAVHPRAPPLQA